MTGDKEEKSGNSQYIEVAFDDIDISRLRVLPDVKPHTGKTQDNKEYKVNYGQLRYLDEKDEPKILIAYFKGDKKNGTMSFYIKCGQPTKEKQTKVPRNAKTISEMSCTLDEKKDIDAEIMLKGVEIVEEIKKQMKEIEAFKKGGIRNQTVILFNPHKSQEGVSYGNFVRHKFVDPKVHVLKKQKNRQNVQEKINVPLDTFAKATNATGRLYFRMSDIKQLATDTRIVMNWIDFALTDMRKGQEDIEIADSQAPTYEGDLDEMFAKLDLADDDAGPSKPDTPKQKQQVPTASSEDILAAIQGSAPNAGDM